MYSFIHQAYWFFYYGSQTVPQAGDSEMNNHEFGPHNLVEGKRDIKSKYRKLSQVWQNK